VKFINGQQSMYKRQAVSYKIWNELHLKK